MALGKAQINLAFLSFFCNFAAQKIAKEGMRNFLSKYWQLVLLAVMAVGVFCFWLFRYPFIPVVREGLQLFLWTGDYFAERIVIPGGFAQYLGEMICQFFINPINGAIAYTVIFIVAQLLSAQWVKRLFPSMKAAYRFVLSLVVPALLWWMAMNPQIPMTLTVAVLLVMGAGCLQTHPQPFPEGKGEVRRWVSWGCWVLVAVPVMYWLAGPVAVVLCLLQTHPPAPPCEGGEVKLILSPFQREGSSVPLAHKENLLGGGLARAVCCLSDRQFLPDALPAQAGGEGHRLYGCRQQGGHADEHLRGNGVRHADAPGGVAAGDSQIPEPGIPGSSQRRAVCLS